VLVIVLEVVLIYNHSNELQGLFYYYSSIVVFA